MALSKSIKEIAEKPPRPFGRFSKPVTARVLEG